ncbi:hypothetical protein CsatB_006773 [Cannabis sativa]
MPTLHQSVDDITPTTVGWKIKMTVLQKFPPRTSMSSPVRYQKLYLSDPKGTRVDAVIFADDIEALEDTLHELHTYHISDARVNRTPARYLKNGTNYPFSWTLNSKTQVVEVQEEDKQISKPVHEFVSFKNLSSDKYSNTPQDIIGVAVKINPTKVVNTVYGQRTIQEIYLIDDSCSFHPICLTLWGALVQDISEKLSEVTGNNPIIMGTKMIVQTKRGTYILTTTIYISINFVHSSILKILFYCRCQAVNQVQSKSILTIMKQLLFINADINNIIIQAPTYQYSPNSSAAKREYVKNNEVTDLVKQLKPTQKAYYWIEAEIILKNINQDFYYMSCDFCNKKLMFYNDNEETDCENPKCGKRCLPTPRARTYVQLDDGTELLDAVMFGDVAENIFSCTAVQLRSYSDEKHKLFVQKTTKQLSAKKWRIQLYVDANRTMTSKYIQFTIQAVEPMED